MLADCAPLDLTELGLADIAAQKQALLIMMNKIGTKRLGHRRIRMNGSICSTRRPDVDDLYPSPP
jgi:hypothetical protein